MVTAIVQELEMQKAYLATTKLDSVYFGGGTPSLLTGEDLDLIFEKINELYTLSPDAEVTLEANPDDITEEKLEIFKQSPINRLSIGIQSFSDADECSAYFLLCFDGRAQNRFRAFYRKR